MKSESDYLTGSISIPLNRTALFLRSEVCNSAFPSCSNENLTEPSTYRRQFGSRICVCLSVYNNSNERKRTHEVWREREENQDQIESDVDVVFMHESLKISYLHLLNFLIPITVACIGTHFSKVKSTSSGSHASAWT